VPSALSAQLKPQKPKVDRLRTKVTLKVARAPHLACRWPIPKGLKEVLSFADSANFAVAQLGLSVAKVPTDDAMLTLCLSSRVHTSECW
jgi:hypothetical protein